MVSFNNWCRTCGSESKQLQEIGDFQDIVLLFTNFNDGSHTFKVCEECIASMNMIRKFADQCVIADIFFTDHLMSLESIKHEEKLSYMVCKVNTDNSPDSKSRMSVNDVNPFKEIYNTEVLETSPRTRSLTLRQKQSVLKSKLSRTPRKILICDLCNKHYRLHKALVKHMESIHSNSKPNRNPAAKHKKVLHTNFNCDQCKKSFKSEKPLKNHQKRHSIQRRYDCTTCQKSFSNTSCLKSHLDTHNDTSYICPECGLKLNTKRTLRQHMLKHSDFKRFKCNICGSQFKRTKTFKEHLIIHSDLRPYSCMWCDKTFKGGANCRKHKKETHPVELAEYEALGVKMGVVLPKIEQLM